MSVNKDKGQVITLRYALKTSTFWMLTLLSFNGLYFGVIVASIYKQVDLENLSDETLTIAGAIGTVCNGCSRVFWPTLSDKFGFRRVYYCLLTVQLITSFCIYRVRSNAVLYILCVALAFLCEGGHFSLFSVAGVTIFGVENGALINTFVNWSTPMTSLFGLFMINYCQQYIGTSNIFNIASGLTVINLVILYFFDDRPKVIKTK